MYRLKTTANFNVGGGGTVEEVIHDNTLIGKGTSESPLKVDQSKFAKPTDLNGKQDTLVSGTNIKTINNQSLLGSGNINIEGGSGEGLSTEVKNAILDCFENVAWTSADGQQYYDALSDLFFPPKTLVSISVVFNQGQAVIYENASLDSLRQYLTVTGLYDDESTETITNYSLSGTLSEGSSIVTVTYQGKTTTFTVNVTARPTITGIEATYTQGSTVVYDDDTLDSLKTNLVVKQVYSDGSKVTLDTEAYTLSGTLTEGTSTITVTYSTFTTTFTVTVTARAELSSISAVFNQGNNTIYMTDDLNTLKQYLTVTANYTDGSTEILQDSDYTLSGSLLNTNNYIETTSTITAIYEEKSDTFTVNKKFKVIVGGHAWENSANNQATGLGYDCTSVRYNRATTDVFGFAIETGKTYNFSIGNLFPTYQISYGGMNIPTSSATSLDNTVKDAKRMIYTSSTRRNSFASGWITDANSFSYTADGSYTYIFVVIRKANDQNVTASDIQAIQNALTYSVTE